jgi:phosphoribosyl-AMP cyclohydrolase
MGGPLPLARNDGYSKAMTQASFPVAPSKQALERGDVLAPRFDAAGLIAAIAQHAETGEILMLGYMNAEALARTLEIGEAVYFSRSRNEIWHKGATSGQIQKLVELRVDCDQDCVLLKVLPQGDGGACHVGFRSCFYRVAVDGKLEERP